MPKLSIITINFNNKAGLEKTINSVISQSYKDFEYIVVDGASTDGSVELIKKYANRITEWVSEKDNGIYHAMNKGILKANGEYCLFLNSGDCLANSNILKTVFFKNYSEDILYGDMMIDWGNGKITTEKMHPKISLYEMYTDTVWHPVSFIKRILFEKYGNYDEQFKIVADYEFFFRTIIANQATTRHIKIPISMFAWGGTSSLQENKAIEQEERQEVWKKYLTPSQLKLLEKKIQEVNTKNKRLFNRIINKLKT